MLPAVILAGGASTRMGSPKALLDAGDGRSFVVRIVRTLRAAGLVDITVVTGSQHDAIAAVLARDDLASSARLVRNPDPARGQLSSLWVGMDALDAASPGLLMTLVDVPNIVPRTVAAVVDAWRERRAPVVRPIVHGRRGHPVIFDRVLFDELRRASLTEGARSVVRAHQAESIDVPVDDPGCLLDVDTPSDYAAQRRGSID